MIYDLYLNAVPDSTLFAKPVPHTAPWSNDVIIFTEDDAYPGNYVAELDGDTRYVVYYGDPDIFDDLDPVKRRMHLRTSIDTRSASTTSAVAPDGLNRILIRVVSGASGLPIPNATIRTDAMQADMSQIDVTDIDGESVFFAGDGDFSFAVKAPNHQITSITQTIDDDTEIVITASLAVGAVTIGNTLIAEATCISGQGQIISGLDVHFELTEVYDGDRTGDIYSTDPFTVTSDSTGLIQANLFRRASYIVRVGNSQKQHKIRTSNADYMLLPDLYQ